MIDRYDFSTFPSLSTERLHLRQLRPDDAEAMMAIYSLPEMMRYILEPTMKSAADASRMIEWFSADFGIRRAVQWAFTLHGDDQMIGTGGLYGWDRSNQHIEIGYQVLPRHWGKGYATEAARAMVRWGFEHLDIHRIQATCMLGNHASERVLLKCGFTLEGVSREAVWWQGEFVSIMHFGLLREETKNLAPSRSG